ncbi:hypothetical protein BX616_001920 [Lobosporangium transversale]|uniref:Uncharacterized protein n=1 Tax=Lobosporangium transversale TaxID=64571 RepID=A0A1Y2GY64_9FUNG|nr:hypothetical protein BCR41DRAFT_416690 [Lobosporangium transversale]KAF9902466.1 hypothetical protein BX616_001920 [Lobosporangium transversale]ORZ23713.1 hypothetical protein BCR41DRAFT_416690 [Lobosporangium transversale]|eukprot:XP_021883527.1 hypothetical protein BCR41DRAFT_416690 [Lobosporangium transversale]
MLVKMNIVSCIHKLDRIALDGGYSGFVIQTDEPSDAFSYEDFSFPVRKTHKNYIVIKRLVYFDQALKGDMQSTLSEFTHDAPIRFSDPKTFDLQFKLCCLLMAIKNTVPIHNIATQTYYISRTQDAFDFPDRNECQVAYEKLSNIKVKLNHDRSLLGLQEGIFIRSYFAA